jgi:hypothetical protein
VAAIAAVENTTSAMPSGRDGALTLRQASGEDEQVGRERVIPTAEWPDLRIAKRSEAPNGARRPSGVAKPPEAAPGD